MNVQLDLIKPPHKILIIKPSAFGDIVHSLPFLHTIKKCFPESEIHWVVSKDLKFFLEDHPLIDKLWVFKRRDWVISSKLFSTVGEIVAFCKGLRKERFDISIDLSGLLRSGLITFFAGAQYKLGFKESDEGSPFFYTHKIEGGREIHAIDRYLKIASFLGCKNIPTSYPFSPFPEHPPICDQLPSEYIIMVPSAGKEANRWPAERYGQLAARLPMPSVMIGSKGDADVVNKAVEAASGNAIDLVGKTSLKDLLPVIRNAQFMVTNDTGPMHIAAAFNVPVFAIFGPANPTRTGPYGNIHTVIREELDCAPCYRWKPCDDWQCMENITVDRVYNTIKEKMFADQK